MSVPHKFKGELLSNFVHTYFDNKVKVTLAHDSEIKLPRNANAMLFGWSYGGGRTLLTIKCKAFTGYIPIKHTDEKILDRELEDFRVYFEDERGQYQSPSLSKIKKGLMTCVDIIDASIGGSNKKYYTFSSDGELISCKFSGLRYTVNISLALKNVSIKYSPKDHYDRVYPFKTNYCEITWNDFDSESKDFLKTMKQKMKNLKDFESKFNTILNEEMELLNQRLLQRHDGMYGE